MVEVTVRHPDGSEETIPATVSWSRRQIVGGMRRARITVPRSDAQAVTLNRKTDEVDLGSIDTLRLVDVETGGSTWTLVCYSFEWDANAVAPTAGGTVYSGSDADIISALVGEVPSWTLGNTTEQATGMSFILNHAHRHEAVRKVEDNIPGEIQFRDSGTVDLVDRLGTDRSGSVEISSAAGTIEDAIQITERGRELDGTHIRVLGAHEGEAQYFANLVPQADPNTYENEVRYSSPRWSDASDTDWDRWENKDVADQATIEEEAAALADEIAEPLVEAEATVSGVDLNIGDAVQVVKPDADLNREMRIKRLKRVVTGAKDVYECLFSTRSVARNDDNQDLRDIQRFNTAFQGDSMVFNTSGGEQVVGPDRDYRTGVFYPEDVAFEHRVNLRIEPHEWVAPFSGTTAMRQDTDTYDTAGMWPVNDRRTESEAGTVSNEGVWVQLDQLIGPYRVADAGHLTVVLQFEITNGKAPNDVRFRLRDDDTDETFSPQRLDIKADDFTSVVWSIPSGTEFNDLVYDVRFETANNAPYDYRYNSTLTSYENHRHEPNPGTFRPSTPTAASDVDVYVNGVQQNSDPLFPRSILAYDQGVGDADWSSAAVQNSQNVIIDRQSSLLRAETDTAAGDPRAEAVWYWETFPQEGFPPLESIVTIDSGDNTTLEPDSSDATSGIAITVNTDPTVTLANTPSEQVILTQTETMLGGEGEILMPTSNPLLPDLSDEDRYLKFHVFGADGDDCILRIRYVDTIYNYGYNDPYSFPIDLRGEMIGDRHNKIRVTSATVGQLLVNFDADVYRQIGKN